VNYDIIVRTTEGDVVQMKYGEDGVDPMKSYHGRPVDIDTIIEEEISSEEN
jgi:DNA-directed RNA polymerase subunit A'